MIIVPDGIYKAKGCRPLLMTKSKGGDDRAIVSMRISQGPHEGKTIDFRGMLKGGATPITLAALESFGYDGSDDSVMKNEVEIVVETSEFDGKERSEIKYVNDPNRAPQYTQLTPAEEVAAKGRLRSLLAASKANAGAKSESDPGF